MSVFSERIELSTDGDGDSLDLTRSVATAVRSSEVIDGAVTVFAQGSTAAITTMEYEPGGIHDLREALERLIPREASYEHNRLNGDTNSHAHMRASIVGPSVTVPIQDGRLVLGTWQQIVLLDFDDRPRRRTVVVQVLG